MCLIAILCVFILLSLTSMPFLVLDIGLSLRDIAQMIFF